MGNYFDQQIAEDWLSVARVRRLYDDDNDGTADVDPLDQAINDSEAEFEATAICVYPSLTQLRAVAPQCLWILRAVFLRTCAERWPKAFGQTAEYWITRGVDLLKQLRENKIRIPVESAPNPPANSGGEVEVYGEAEVGTDNEPMWRNGTGAF